MSSLKTVQEEIEKALAASLKTRFNSVEHDFNEFDERDVEKLRRNDSEGELYLRLFIRSTQGDLEKAYSTMIESLKWRKEYGIRDINEDWLREDSVKTVVEGEGILFYHNTDIKKNPILIFQGNKYQYKKDQDKEQILEKLFAYLLEKQHQQRLGKQIVVICDHHNATLEHMDLKFFKFVANLFNIYYPNILDSFLVVDVSWRVSSAWRNIQKWFSPDTSSKFKFVEKEKLTDYVDKSKLLVSLGGRDEYKYEYPSRGEAQDPLEPFINVNDDYDTDSQSNFQDAIENPDESDTTNPEELTRHNASLPTDSMPGSSIISSVRNRFSGPSAGRPQSIEEITCFEDGPPHNNLIISPSEEITFQETEDASEVYETLTLTNNCENTIIFKVKTNSAANFRVKPSVGALEPNSSKEVVVMLLLKGEASHDKHHWNKDKFLILYAEHTEEISSETNISELWKDTPKSCTREYKLNCRVLDVNGLEKRPKTIDDAVEMNLKLQQQISQIQTKMENFTNPLKDINEQLQQQKRFFFVVSIFFLILLLLMYWFR